MKTEDNFLIIMRHGNASHYADSDSRRPLTHRGVQECRKSFLQYREWIVKTNYLICSPYLRAEQSANAILKEAMSQDKKSNQNKKEEKWSPSIETWDTIAPEGDVIQVADQLLHHYQEQKGNLILVSHMPLVGSLTYYLTENSLIGTHFSTAQIAVIRFDSLPLPGCCRVKAS